MIYNAYKSTNPSNLIDDFFEFTISKSSLPFQSIVLPVGQHSISNVHRGDNKLTVDDKTFQGKGLILSGQTTKSYLLDINTEYGCCGIMFHPTALYKLTQIDVSTINNKHIPLNEFSKRLYDALNTFFKKNIKGNEALKTLESLLKEMPLVINNHTEYIDKALAIIHQKRGQIIITDLLNQIPFSQKTLETKFKQMVGLTPKKYARLYRFSTLMKKYNENELKLNELVGMYNFHDSSHFSKEFKYFMNESPKSYFKNESEFIKKYLK